MSVPTLAELLAAKSQDEWTAIALTQLQQKGFPTTDWGSTAPERAMLETDMACVADLDTQIPLIVALMLVQIAQGSSAPNDPASAALQFVAFNWYEIPVFEPTSTVGMIKLTCNALAGPYTITVGQLIATDGKTLYTNSTDGGGVLGTGATIAPEWTALTPGTRGNAGNNTITTLQTPLPGVSINNPGAIFTPVTHTGSGTGTLTPSGAAPVAHDWIIRIDTSGVAGVATSSYSTNGGASFTSAGAAAAYTPAASGTTVTLAGTFIAGDRYAFSAPGSWITTQGTDLETTFSLATRCLARWPELGQVPTYDVYTAWALEALGGQITRVKVETDPSVAATVNIYCAGPSATINAAQVNAVQAYIDTRAPLTDVPVVAAAGSTALTITGAATYPAGRAGGHTDLDANINAYVQGVIMGGKVELAIITALAVALNAAGVATGATNITGVEINAVATDYTLSAHNVATVTNSIVWTAV